MQTFHSLPSLDRLANQMALREELNTVSEKTILGFTIRNGLRQNYPLSKLMAEIISGYEDNQELVRSVVGEKAILLIHQILKK